MEEMRSGKVVGFGIFAGCLLNVLPVNAAQLNSYLQPEDVGITVQQLFSQTTRPVIDGPSYMLGDLGPEPYIAQRYRIDYGYEIGTNTALFVGAEIGSANPETYFLRYTANENSFYQNGQQSNPIVGDLWLSFNFDQQKFLLFSERSGGVSVDWTRSPGSTGVLFEPDAGMASVTNLRDGRIWVGQYLETLPDANADIDMAKCISCNYFGEIGLSFVKLVWNGSEYELVTTIEAQDRVLKTTINSRSSEFYISEVPLPASSVAFASALACVSFVARVRRGRVKRQV